MMRARWVLGLAVAALILSIAARLASQPAAGKKLALLVGIDDYSAVTHLHGCINDVETMKAVLVGKFDFPPENVVMLRNAEATRKGMLQALRNLIDRAAAGDIVVFHYSGHGSRMRDANSDEADGWDETIVPQDSRTPGVFDISDDELNALLADLGRKTRNVTFILDSCHSGTASRGGTAVRQVADDLRPPPPSNVRAAGRGLDGASDMRPFDAEYVLISGCRAGELSNEYDVAGRRQGALTYFLTRALGEAGAGTTWRDVMDTVRGAVASAFPSQHPQLEGARADGWVFGDRDSLAESYVLVSPTAGGAEIQAGAVQGLVRGSRLAVYPPQTRSFAPPAQPLATLELQSVEPFRARATVIDGGPVAPLSRAVLRQVVYPNARLNVHVARSPGSPAVLGEIENALREYPSLAVVAEEGTARILVRVQGDTLHLTSGDLGDLAPPISATAPGAVKLVAEAAASWGRWYRLLDLQNPASRRRVRLTVGYPGSEGDAPAEFRVAEGQDVEIRVENPSDRQLYVVILDLSGDGSVEPLYPSPGAVEELPPGGVLRHVLGAGIPAGRDETVDVVKVIATTEPIDPAVFTQAAVKLATPRGDSSLRAFLEDAAVGRPRTLTPRDPDDWTTAQRRLTVLRGDRSFESFALHFDAEPPPDVGARVAGVRDACGDPDAACWQDEAFADGSGIRVVRSVLPVGRRAVESSFGAAWDEAYRLRETSGAQRAEPLFELELPEPDAEADPNARSTGGEAILPKALHDSRWSLKHVDAPGAWAKLQATGRADGEEGVSVTIAHLDTGYRDHPEFWDRDEAKSRVLYSRGYNFLDGNDNAYDPLDTSGPIPNPSHGTKSGSTIVSPKGKQLVEDTDATHVVDGVAPGAHLVPGRVHRSVVHLTSERLGRAIFEAAGDRRDKLKLPVKVISISMGGVPSWTLWRAVKFAESRGVLVIAAAGNYVRTVVWPARFDETVAVAATNADCGTWSGSSRGNAVDISAPGESVWHAETTLPKSNQPSRNVIGYGSGTTYAVATTAGVAALWLDYHRNDPALADLQRSGDLTRVFRRLVQETSWRPDRGAAQLPPGVTCPVGASWDAANFGPGIVEASRLLAAPLPGGTREVAESRGFEDLPLFASLFPDGTSPAIVVARFGRLLRRPEGTDAGPLAFLEGEVVFQYALGEEVREAINRLTGDAEPPAEAYAAARSALLRQDLSTRLRSVLRGES
jgi:caspase domain-containing protein/subtilase family protein